MACRDGMGVLTQDTVLKEDLSRTKNPKEEFLKSRCNLLVLLCICLKKVLI